MMKSQDQIQPSNDVEMNFAELNEDELDSVIGGGNFFDGLSDGSSRLDRQQTGPVYGAGYRIGQVTNLGSNLGLDEAVIAIGGYLLGRGRRK